MQNQRHLIGTKHNAEKLNKAVHTQRKLGEQAFVKEDQTSYANALASLNAICDHLNLLYYQMTRDLDTRSTLQKTEDRAKGILESVSRLAAARGRTDLQDELQLLP